MNNRYATRKHRMETVSPMLQVIEIAAKPRKSGMLLMSETGIALCEIAAPIID